jgi:hypothetical protein
MTTAAELGQRAARTEKKAFGAAALRMGGNLMRSVPRMLPKSMGGRAALGAGAAGGLHLGQDAARSYMTPESGLQQYYDQNQVASQALGQRAARLGAPTGFRAGADPKSPSLNVGQLVGAKTPQMDIAQPPGFLNRLIHRPVHEMRMSLGGDPGAYKPPPAEGKKAIPGRQITNPDGTITTIPAAEVPTQTSQHTNRSRLAKWLAEMDAAQTGATVERYGQEGDNILNKARTDLAGNLDKARGTANSGNQQYANSRAQQDALYRQLGLAPPTTPGSLEAPDFSRAESQIGGLEQLSADPAALGRAAAQAPAAANTDAEMLKRRNRMRDLSRSWNAY